MVRAHQATRIFFLFAFLLLGLRASAAAQGAVVIDLGITKSGPTTVSAGTDVTYTLTVTGSINNSGMLQAGATITDTLPAGWSVLSATSAAGTCSGTGTGTTTCNLTVPVPGSVTVTVTAHVPGICQPATGTNTATVVPAPAGILAFSDSNPANDQAALAISILQTSLGPGACIPRTPIDSTKPGSILFTQFYASGATSNDVQNNTRINITNTNPTLGVVAHLFFVDGSSCSVADAFICLTPNQTTSFFMSDIDPGTQGYMMAVAVDGPPGYGGGNNTGCPISFNYLIGNANIKFTGSPRRDLDLESESVAAEFGSPVPTCDPDKSFAELFFDGTPRGYNQLPRVLALDSIPSRADGNDTILFLARVDGNWGTGLQPLGTVTGLLYNDNENSFSFNLNAGTCLLRTSLSNSAPRTTPRFDQVIPAGRTGWMKLYAANENAAIIGAMHNRNDNSLSSPGAFEGGHNLHVLTLLPNAVITVPIFPPSC